MVKKVNVSTVLRRAAMAVERGTILFGCPAIKYQKYEFMRSCFNNAKTVDEETVDEALKLFSSMFKPKHKLKCDPWFGYNKHDPHRITALLMAAEVAESEGM